MSSRRPREREVVRDYRHAHQDVRLNGRVEKPTFFGGGVSTPSPRFPEEVASDYGRSHFVMVDKPSPARKKTLGTKVIEATGALAERYGLGRSKIVPAADDEPETIVEVDRDSPIGRLIRLDRLLAEMLQAEGVANDDPTLENLAASREATEALFDFQWGPDSPWADPNSHRHQEWIEYRLHRIALETAPERSSTDILADLNLSTQPVVTTETFSEIYCIFCDRDQLQFMGTNRLEGRIEIALTLNHAFHTMIRMSGFSEEVVAGLDGVDFDNPCLDTLARALNSVTDDHYTFAPYETAMDTRLFNFLQ